MVNEERLLELKEFYKHKRNKHKVGSNHYWRYNGKIEAINDITQEIKTNRWIKSLASAKRGE